MEKKNSFEKYTFSQRAKSSSEKQNKTLKKKWFKNQKLFQKFNFFGRESQSLFPDKNQKFRFFRKQTPRKKINKSLKKVNSVMEESLLKIFSQSNATTKDIDNGLNKKFKLGDFGLSFNKFLGNLLNFGDNKYLAPELLKVKESKAKVIKLKYSFSNFLDRFYKVRHLFFRVIVNQIHSGQSQPRFRIETRFFQNG